MTYTLVTTSGTFTTRSPKKAYAAYDTAFNNGETIISFTNSRGADLRDR